MATDAERRRSRLGVGQPAQSGVTPGQAAADRRRAAAGTVVHGTIEGSGSGAGQWFLSRRRQRR